MRIHVPELSFSRSRLVLQKTKLNEEPMSGPRYRQGRKEIMVWSRQGYEKKNTDVSLSVVLRSK